MKSGVQRVARLQSLAAVGALVALVVLAAVTISGRAECAGEPVQVRMSSLSGFTPSTLTVQRGSIVTWVNDDKLPYTVTSSEGAFASQAIHRDESFSFRFETRGTYRYFSGFQPRMTGTIVVR